MIRGGIELDGFRYEIIDGATTMIGPDGPVQNPVKVLQIAQPPNMGPAVAVFFSLADWAEFQRKVAGSSLVVAASMPAGLNGH